MKDLDFDELDRVIGEIVDSRDSVADLIVPKLKTTKSVGRMDKKSITPVKPVANSEKRPVRPSRNYRHQARSIDGFRPTQSVKQQVNQVKSLAAARDSANGRSSSAHRSGGFMEFTNKVAINKIVTSSNSNIKDQVASKKNNSLVSVVTDRDTETPVGVKRSSLVNRRSASISSVRRGRGLSQPKPTMGEVVIDKDDDTRKSADSSQVKNSIKEPYKSPFLADVKVEKKPLGSVQPLRRQSQYIGRPKNNYNNRLSRGMNYNQDMGKSELSEVYDNKSATKTHSKEKDNYRFLRFIGWLLLFAAVVSLGTLVGFFIYYSQ